MAAAFIGTGFMAARAGNTGGGLTHSRHSRMRCSQCLSGQWPLRDCRQGVEGATVESIADGW